MSPIILCIRELREARRLTQTQLANRAGVRQESISRLERGLAQGVAFDTLEKIADALEVSPASLVVRVRRNGAADQGDLAEGCGSAGRR